MSASKVVKFEISFLFFCCSVKIKLMNVEFEPPDFNFDHKHFGKHRGDHMTPEAGSQSANQL